MAKEYVIEGKVMMLYSIGELARAIGKQPVTIRKWEETGFLPNATYRDTSNRRLYTREQVEGVAELTAEYMKQGTKTPQEFIEGVKKLFVKKEEDNE